MQQHSKLSSQNMLILTVLVEVKLLGISVYLVEIINRLNPLTRLPNARMLNIWLNIKHKCSMKKIKKSGNVMQQSMHSCVCGKNTSSESILIRSYLLFAR